MWSLNIGRSSYETSWTTDPTNGEQISDQNSSWGYTYQALIWCIFLLVSQSHHKKPIKATVAKGHLYISDGYLSSDNSLPIPAKDQPARPPSRQILHHPFTSQVCTFSTSSITNKKIRVNLISRFIYLLYVLVQINLILSNAEKPRSMDGSEATRSPEILKQISDLGRYQHFSNLNLADLLLDEFVQTYFRSGSSIYPSTVFILLNKKKTTVNFWPPP
jgi:hypothetical protein